MAKSEATSPYSNDNPRFRKAMIRERLATLKIEREALIAERDEIDRALGAKKSYGTSVETPQA